MASIQETPIVDVNKAIERVASKAEEWKVLPIQSKIEFLQKILNNLRLYGDEWVDAGMKSRGVDPKDPSSGYARGEINLLGPAEMGGHLNQLIFTLSHIAKKGVPPPPNAVRQAGDKTIVTVSPKGLLFYAEASFMEGELVLSEEKSTQMSVEEAFVGGVVGILGAGNFNTPTEVLSEMFLKGRVCVYKANPVNEKLMPTVKKMFAPLVSSGYIEFVFGGSLAGGAMIENKMVDEIVITGSSKTYNKIVWGATPEEQEANKAASTPKVTKPICSELGSVNPWIVVPGKEWTNKMTDIHAQHIVAASMYNNGHVCASPQVIITSKDWKDRDYFMDRIHYWSARHAASPPFYPGSKESHEHFSQLPGAQVIDGGVPSVFKGQQNQVLIKNVTQDSPAWADLCKRESFCHVLSEMPLENASGNPMDFLRKAVDFAEKELFGSLTMSISIDDGTQKASKKEFDEILANMHFGVVGVNIWAGFIHLKSELIWGAFPGHDSKDIQSGMGFVGNAHLYKGAEKAILRAPFFHFPRFLVLSASHFEKCIKRLSSFFMNPGWFGLIALVFALILDI